MGKRPSKVYRKLQLPYTRKEYIGRMMDVPEGMKKSTFGNPSKLDFPAKLKLVSQKDGQISARALVSVRVALHRELRVIGEQNYRLNITSYPHHCARSHGLVGVAKAERISSGMGKGSYGFPEMRLAQIKKGHAVLEIAIENDAVAYGIAQKGLRLAMARLPPFNWQIVAEGISQDVKQAKVTLPKRAKEEKKTGGQLQAELQRELK